MGKGPRNLLLGWYCCRLDIWPDEDIPKLLMSFGIRGGGCCSGVGMISFISSQDIIVNFAFDTI